ncbi:MAG: TetR/AcrR family transcriptional regulator [Myxococcota bacterium]
MARPPNADAAVTRTRILDAALDLFAERGFFGTSMRQIGAAAGLTSSALYHHFPSKEDILHAIVAETMTSGPVQVRAALVREPAPPLPVLLRRFCTALLDFFEQPRQKRLWRVIMSDGYRLAAEGKIPVDALGNAQRRLLAEGLKVLMDRGVIRQADPELAAMELVGPLFMYRQLTTIWGVAHLTAPIDRERFVDNHVDTLVRAFSPVPTPVVVP